MRNVFSLERCGKIGFERRDGRIARGRKVWRLERGDGRIAGRELKEGMGGYHGETEIEVVWYVWV